MKAIKAFPFSFIFAGLLLISCGTDSPARHERSVARNIILIIGDGMHIEHEIAASRYLYGVDFALSFHQLPYQADVTTWDVSTYNAWAGALGLAFYDPDSIQPFLGYDPARGGEHPYPLVPEPPGAQAYHTFKASDSAAAATAWATGFKTDGGNVAWLPGDPVDGELETVAERLREKKGFSIGVVTTVPFTHATSAAHVSHNVDRNNFTRIGTEILTRIKPEVVIGGGHPGNAGASVYKYISRQDHECFRNGACSDGYVFVERTAGVEGGASLLKASKRAAAEQKKLFGLFGSAAGNFESPHDPDDPALLVQTAREDPTFSEAIVAALDILSNDPDGFFLMAEQGEIDWANHANDFRRMIGAVKNLHDGVQAVIDYVDRPGDHLEWSNTLLIVTSDHGNSYMRNRVELGAGQLPQQIGAGLCGYDRPPCTYPGGEVTYASAKHTNELVRLYAIGAGAGNFKKYEGKWYPGTRIVDNTQIFHVMMEAAGEPVPSSLRLKQKD